MIKMRQDNDMTYRIGFLYAEKDIELSCPIRLDSLWQRPDNDMTNHTSVVYTKIDSKLSRPIEQCAIYD